MRKMSEKIIARTTEILNKSVDGLMTFAVLDENGYPSASVVTITNVDGIKEIMFCSGLDSNKAKRVQNCGKASLCYFTGEFNITLVGTAEILTDPEIKARNWRDGWEWIFPEGHNDPNFCVFRFKTERYSLYVDNEEVAGNL